LKLSLSGCLKLGASAALIAASAAAASPSPETGAAIASWTTDIAALPLPAEGCFAAAFPERAWHATQCKAAPRRPYFPVRAGRKRPYTVGNGVDYALTTTSIIRNAVGSFPAVTGLKSETGYGGAANTYSLQLNSGFMNTAACNTGAAGCQSWQQFIYSSSSNAVFMQYWLIGYNTNGVTCPSSAWISDGAGDCYTNSNAVTAPQISATKLGGMSIFGSARLNGSDEVKFTSSGTAYAVTGKDSVVDLATAWQQNEFNVVGDGGGSEANFNKGTSVKVKIAVADGSTAAPSCPGNAGTTGETNNLNLAPTCSRYSGTYPTILFVESN
jgi:hypothetical protein